jgi:pyridoxamine 5'-phosphate oxidase family protein
MTFTPAERNYLGTQRLGRLATVDEHGAPQNNPVGFQYNPDTGTVDIGGLNMGATRKFRNVRTNANVAFVVDDIASIKPWVVRGIEIRGRAEALDGQPHEDRPYLSPEIIRIHPEQVFTWGIEPDAEGMRKRLINS